MIKYIVEEGNSNSFNIFLTDEEERIKTLVAVVFDYSHAKIITRKMNEYANNTNMPNKEL